MNDILQPYLDKFVVVYLDDICIFSNNLEDHLTHVDQVLSTLEAHDIYLGLDKSAFGLSEMDFLGHVVGQGGIRPDPAKIQAVQDWPTPTKQKHIRAFLGLTGYYRRFIKDYARIALPLTNLTKDHIPWKWGEAEASAFKQLQSALTTAPLLVMPDPALPYEVFMDASGFALGAVLLQNQGKGLQPIAFISRKLNEAEQRYPKGDRELLAIMYALLAWRCYLEGARFKINSDHLNHTWFHKKRAQVLTRRQAKWMLWMESYYGDAEIEYKEGKQNMADALSRRPDLDTAFSLNVLSAATEGTLLEQLRHAYTLDPWYASSGLPKPGFSMSDGIWYFQNRIVVPRDTALRKLIISECHDVGSAGHQGITRTLQRVASRFWWPHMSRTVSSWVLACPSCQRNKPTNQRPIGLLNPLPVPSYKWEQMTMDLITDLPTTKHGYNAIVTFIDRLSKHVHFAPTTKTVNAPQLARIFRKTVYSAGHGIPRVIITDRDERFLSHFWRSFFDMLGTQLKFTTAYHPQTDGQSERTNRILEEYLRHFVSPLQDDWDDYLDMAEFAINDSVQTSTGYSPFYMTFGQNPITAIDLSIAARVPAAVDFATEIHDTVEHAKTKLQEASLRQTAYENKSRRDIVFKIGDKVKLSTTNLRLPSTMTAKLAPKFIGPYIVDKVISPVVYKLKLPASMSRIHPVFHVSLLQPWKVDKEFVDHVEPAPLPPVYQGDNQYYVEALLDKRMTRVGRHDVIQYLIRWKGYGPEEDQWVESNNIEESLIDIYEATHHAEIPVARRSTRRSIRFRRPYTPP
jgi:transposase InsO family protein